MNTLRTKRTLNQTIIIFSFCGLSFYIISIIVFLTAEIERDSYDWSGYPYPFINISWGSANIFAYLLYILRLKISFKGTSYATSSTLFHLFYLLISLFFASQIFETVLNIGAIYDFMSMQTTQTFFIATFGFDQLIDGIMSIMLLAIFIHKLFAVTIDTLDYDEMSKRKLIILDRDSQRWLNLVTKQFVLSTYAIISTQCYIFWNSFSGIVYSEIVWKFDENANYGLYILCVLLFCNDCISNAIAIWLNSSFNDKRYFRICKPCDRCCGYCCNKLAKREVKRRLNIKSSYVLMVAPLSDDGLNM